MYLVRKQLDTVVVSPACAYQVSHPSLRSQNQTRRSPLIDFCSYLTYLFLRRNAVVPIFQSRCSEGHVEMGQDETKKAQVPRLLFYLFLNFWGDTLGFRLIRGLPHSKFLITGKDSL